MSANFSLQSVKAEQIENNEQLRSSTLTRDAVIKADSKVNGFLSFTYKGEARFTSSATGGVSSTTAIGQVPQQLSLNYSPSKNLISTLSEDNYIIHSTGSANTSYNFFDVKMRYKLSKSRFELEVDLMNLMNTTAYKTINLTGNFYNSTVYAIPGRFLLFKCTFNL